MVERNKKWNAPRRDLRRESAAARRSSSMETAAEPGRMPRSARHRAPRRDEKLGLARDPGIVISAPASDTEHEPTRHTSRKRRIEADWRGGADRTSRRPFAIARGRDWDRGTVAGWQRGFLPWERGGSEEQGKAREERGGSAPGDLYHSCRWDKLLQRPVSSGAATPTRSPQLHHFF